MAGLSLVDGGLMGLARENPVHRRAHRRGYRNVYGKMSAGEVRFGN